MLPSLLAGGPSGPRKLSSPLCASKMTRWLNCGVISQVSWPKTEKTVKYGVHIFILRPLTEKHSASVHIPLNGMTHVQGMTVINRFLSALAWKNDQPTITHNGFSGSSVPQAIPVYQVPLGYSTTDCFPNELIEIKDEKCLRAIALYREGLGSLHNVPFKFLSFFKVLNVFWNDKKTKGVNPLVEGIRAELPNLADRDAQARIAEIGKQHVDVAEYLYKYGRCAVAHAFQKPVVDPDDVADLHGLSENLWLMRRLAAHVIFKHFGIKQSLFS